MKRDDVVASMLTVRCSCGGGKRDSDGRCCYCRALRAEGDPVRAAYQEVGDRGALVGFVVGLFFGIVIGALLAKLFQA